MSGAAIAVMVRRSREEIARHFIDTGATGPEHAVPFDPNAIGWRHARIRRRIFRRMRDFGAIKEVGAGAFYLDQQRATEFGQAMRRRALGFAAVAIGAVAAIAALA